VVSKSISVKDATFGLLRAFGIKKVFGNPGSTELPFLSDWPDDSVPPRLTASLRICGAFRNLNAAAWPPTMSNENVEPAPVHCLANRRPAGEAHDCAAGIDAATKPRGRYPALTYFRQLCASWKPSTSRAFRFDSGASYSPSSRVIGTLGQ
jgi:hypothetical protein